MQTKAKSVRTRRLALFISALGLLSSGCRLATRDGYRYGTADANTIGRPAVILETVRTSAYRTDPLPRQHAQVRVTRLPDPKTRTEAVQAPPEEYTGSTPLLDLSR